MDERKNKMWHICMNGLVFSLKKEEDSDMLQHGWIWGHDLRWNKPIQEDKYCVWIHSYEQLDSETEVEWWLSGAGGRGKVDIAVQWVRSSILWGEKSPMGGPWQGQHSSVNVLHTSEHLKMVKVANWYYVYLPQSKQFTFLKCKNRFWIYFEDGASPTGKQHATELDGFRGKRIEAGCNTCVWTA